LGAREVGIGTWGGATMQAKPPSLPRQTPSLPGSTSAGTRRYDLQQLWGAFAANRAAQLWPALQFFLEIPKGKVDNQHFLYFFAQVLATKCQP